MKKTVLILDDSAVVRDAVSVVLEASGFTVRTAATLDELEAKRADRAVDLYVLDVQMPEAFGDEIGELLKDVQDVGVPILLFSSLEEDLLRERAAEAGLAGYVPKSAGVPALLARIRALV